jgi:L-fuconolactonase
MPGAPAGIRVVDTHVHIVSPDHDRYPLRPASGFHSPGLGPWQLETPVSAEQLLDLAHAAGVERAMVVQPFSAYGYDNAYHADSAERYPTQLLGVCAVDPFAPDAAQQLTYWVRQRGMRGLRLTTTRRESIRLDDPRAYPLWECAGALRIPVCLLTAPSHWDDVSALASRFPAVTIALDHAGGIEGAQSAVAVDALLRLARHPNTCLKLSTVNLAMSAPQLDAWQRIVAAFGPQRLMWGSNYPVSQEGTYADMVGLGRRALPFLSESDRHWFLTGTATSLWPPLA